MCSVIGYKGNYNEELLDKIFKYSRIRGLHSFGYSYYNPELTTKKFLDYENFVSSIHKDRPTLFIAHFRYSTSGDFLTQENNQPITLNSISIAFNGVISQGTKSEMEEEFNLTLPSENDGYILLQKYKDKEFLKSDITYAAVGLNERRLFALRNDRRPLWYKLIDGGVIVSSTADILNRSGIENPTEINPITEYSW